MVWKREKICALVLAVIMLVGLLPSVPIVQAEVMNYFGFDAQTDFNQMNLGALPTGSETTDWRKNSAAGGNVASLSATIEAADAGNKLLNISYSTSGQGQLRSPLFQTPATGENVVIDIRLQNKTTIQGAKNSIIFRSSVESATVLNFDFIRTSSDPAGKAKLHYFNASNTATAGTYQYDNNTWYRMVVLLNTTTVTYDLYMYDNENNELENRKGMKAHKATAIAPANCNLTLVETYLNQSDSGLLYDYIKVFNDPNYELPKPVVLPSPVATPSIAPSSSPAVSPSPVVTPSIAPSSSPAVSPSPNVSAMPTKIVQVDGPGYTQMPATDVSYANRTTGWVVSGIKIYDGVTPSKYTEGGSSIWARYDPGFTSEEAGTYNVFYDNVFTANAVRMTATVRASGINLPFTYPLTTVSSRQWSLVGQYTFLGNGDEYVQIQGAGAQYARVSAVKFELVEAIEMPPFARNVRFTGSLSTGNDVTAAYEYVDYSNDVESGSKFTLYSANAADATEWNIALTGEAKADGFTIALPAALEGKYVKLGVLPCNDNPEDKDKSIEAFSDVIGPLVAGNVPPVASNVRITEDAEIGAKLIAQYIYSDQNADKEYGSVYKWYVSSGEMAWQEITAAAGMLEYTIPVELKGKYIRFSVTPKNQGINGVGQETTSNTVGPVTESSAVPIVTAVKYGGKVVMAENLIGAAVGGMIEPTYTYTHLHGLPEDTENTKYQWYYSFTPNGMPSKIEGATEATYTPTDVDAGKYIRVGITPVSTNGAVGNEYIHSGMIVKWKLTFYDDFDYEAPDGYNSTFLEKWISDRGIRPLGSPMIYQIRIPENIEVTEGKLIIHNRKEHLSNYADLDARMAKPHDWTTGNIWSRQKLGPEGYYEASYKYAYATGLNQSFWAMTQGNPNYSATEPSFLELDFNEGHFPREIKTNLHYFNSSGGRVMQSIGYYPLGSNSFTNIQSPNFGDNFHKFGGYFRQNDPSEAWNTGVNASNFRVYSDDKQIRSTRGSPNLSASVHIYFSIAIYPGFAGPLDQVGANGSQMEVDYVRFYELLSATKTDLDRVIQTAKELTENAVGGNATGNYPPNAISTLSGLISPAEVVFGKNDPTQDEINQAINALSEGIDAFLVQVVGDRSALIDVVEEAEKLLIDHPAGLEYLECRPLAHQRLKDLTLAGRAVLDSLYPKQGKIDEHIQPITDMIQTFLNNINYNDPSAPSPSPSADPTTTPSQGPSQAPSQAPFPAPSYAPTDSGNPGGPGYGPGTGVVVLPPTVGGSKVSFNDISGHWAEKEIKELSKDKIINGRSEKEFAPEDAVTRAEFATMIRRALNLNVALYSNQFADANENDWFANEIAALAVAGIMEGADGYFRPNDLITREEITKAVVNAYMIKTGVSDIEAPNISFDDEISGWAEPYIKKAVALNLMTGMGNNEFGALLNATRAQSAVVIYRLIK